MDEFVGYPIPCDVVINLYGVVAKIAEGVKDGGQA